MSVPATTTELAVTTSPGRPPILQLDATAAAAPLDWIRANRDALRATAVEHGAVMVRGLGLSDHDLVGQCFHVLGDTLLSDDEAFAARHRHREGVYSSAAWPDHQQMCMHHELSYRKTVPALAMFACLTAPETGGVTGLADASAVLDDLPGGLVDRFAADGWLLLRTYGGDIGPSVADALGTDDQAGVEAYCRANDIEYAWQSDGSLRTRQQRPAVITHPRTGARCWFNQVAFLSEWTIDPEVREFLVDMYGSEGLPFTTAYGDGTPIDAEVIETLNAVYEARTVREPWQAGDLLLVDNLATAHSREPFTGDREILVALSDPTDVTGGPRWVPSRRSRSSPASRPSRR